MKIKKKEESLMYTFESGTLNMGEKENYSPNVNVCFTK